MKSTLFWVIVLGFLFGNILGAFFNIGFVDVAWIALMSSLLGMWSWFRYKKTYSPYIRFFLTSIVFLYAVLLGVTRFLYTEHTLLNTQLDSFDTQVVEVIGKVTKEPVRKEAFAQVFVEVSALKQGEQVVKGLNEQIVVSVSFFEAPLYGDVVVLSGTLKRIKNFSADFDFVNYSKKDRVLFQMYLPSVEVIKNIGNPFILKLKAFKAFFETTLEEYVSEPHSSLISGMLIAGKGALSDDVETQFIKTGLIHIVVLSGFNIAIIILFISSVCRFLKLRQHISFLITITTLILFVLMAGASAPVVRSAVMAGIVLFASLSYRKLDANRVLFFVAGVLACLNPYSLPFDPSFQLSFLATFAIINLSKPVEKYLMWIHARLLRETLSQTVAVILFVSPFILYTMGNFSIVAIVTNLLVLPVVPWLMLGGFLVVVLSFIPFLATMFALMSLSISSYVFFVTEFFARLPFASVEVKHISGFFILPIYGLLFWFLYRSHLKKKREVALPASSVTDVTEPY